MAEMSSIERELREVTGVKPKKKDNRQEYLARLAEAVDTLDEQWDDLSHDAQLWANKALTALKGSGDLPEFSDYNGGSKVAEKTSKKKKKKKESGGGEETKKRTGVKVRLKELLWKDPSMSADDIAEVLEKEGHESSMSTIRAIRAEFRHTLKVLVKLGVIDVEL